MRKSLARIAWRPVIFAAILSAGVSGAAVAAQAMPSAAMAVEGISPTLPLHEVYYYWLRGRRYWRPAPPVYYRPPVYYGRPPYLGRWWHRRWYHGRWRYW